MITYQYAKINTAKYIIKGFITHTQPLDKCQIIPDYPIENIIILGINNKPLSVLNSVYILYIYYIDWEQDSFYIF